VNGIHEVRGSIPLGSTTASARLSLRRLSLINAGQHGAVARGWRRAEGLLRPRAQARRPPLPMARYVLPRPPSPRVRKIWPRHVAPAA
jgi:hypothetical protein